MVSPSGWFGLNELYNHLSFVKWVIMRAQRLGTTTKINECPKILHLLYRYNSAKDSLKKN